MRALPYDSSTAICRSFATPSTRSALRPVAFGPVTDITAPGTTERRTYPLNVLSTLPFASSAWMSAVKVVGVVSDMGSLSSGFPMFFDVIVMASR